MDLNKISLIDTSKNAAFPTLVLMLSKRFGMSKTQIDKQCLLSILWREKEFANANGNDDKLCALFKERTI